MPIVCARLRRKGELLSHLAGPWKYHQLGCSFMLLEMIKFGAAVTLKLLNCLNHCTEIKIFGRAYMPSNLDINGMS
jgi:hypothetical protein